MEYVLVFQFPESHFAGHDEVLAFEDRLRAALPRTHEVDGHDVGSGTVNFFVFTKAPVAAHAAFRKRLGTRAIERNLRVSYREVNGESYMNLWPRRDARPFDISYPDGEDPFSPASKRRIPKRSPPGVSKSVTAAAPRPPTAAKKPTRAKS
ncbi:MAG: hypothetical protein U0235_32390 [Polyangiaceae bacterium]